MTITDDPVALNNVGFTGWQCLMWGNDFPHSDATWPDSQALLAQHTADMTEYERNRVLHDNVAELYGIQLQ